MKTPKQRPDRWLSSSERLYSRLLCLYSRPFRKEFGREMQEAFRDSLEGISRIRQLARLWGRTLIDLLLSVLLDRLSPGGPRPVPGPGGSLKGEELMRSILLDIRYSLRSMRNNPALTLAFLLTLALGVGANTAVFSIVNAQMFRPLPVPDPGQLVVVARVSGDAPVPDAIPYADFRDYRRQVEEFSDLAAHEIGFAGLSAGSKPVRMRVSYVSPSFFPMLGIRPALGRLIVPADGGEGSVRPVLVLGHSFWQKQFGGDPAVVGSDVRLNGAPATVVGVTPQGFGGVSWGLDMDAYLPLALKKGNPREGQTPWWDERGSHFVGIMGRLMPGVSLERVRASLAIVSDRLAIDHPETNKGFKAVAFPENRARPSSHAAPVLPTIMTSSMLMVLLVLLVAAANGLNLMLVHASVRQRSMAVRAALGAGRGRVVRQFLTETLLMSLAGGGAGFLLGLWVIRQVPFFPPSDLGNFQLDFSPDWRVCAYAVGISLLGGLAVGLPPALRISRMDLREALRSVGRSSGQTQPARRLRSLSVMAQVAVSVTLLVAAGLFLRSLQQARQLDLGFQPQGVLNLAMDPGQAGYGRDRAEAFYEEALRRIRSLPQVSTASMAYSRPLGHIMKSADILPQDRSRLEDDRMPICGYNVVGPDYFETMRIPILKGRPLGSQDRADTRRVAVMSESQAERLWPGQDPIGKRFRYRPNAGPVTEAEVVGVSGDGVYRFLLETPPGYFFVPFEQEYESARNLHVRTRAPLAELAPATREIIRQLDPDLPLHDVHSLVQDTQGWLGFHLLNMGVGLASLAGGLGLLLATLGIYGVVSYVSSQRIHEIGIRMALGARRGDVLALILRQGLGLVLAGLLAGLAGASGLGLLLSRLLFGVRPLDLATFAAVTLILAAVGTAASLLPAHRASRADPVRALHSD